MIWSREIFLLFLTSSVTGDVQIYPQFGIPHIIADFSDLPASFGEVIPPKGLSAYLVYANPENACTKIDPPPANVTNPTNRWVVLIKRYNCSFEEKILNAQNASFDLAIVHNVNSNKLERMHSNDPDKIRIPSIFVSATTGRIIKNKYQYLNGYLIQISEDSPWDYNTNIFIPFLIVILICFFTMIGFMIAKCIKDIRRARRRRLPYSSLSKIPITKFRKGDPYETCAICLDDFVEGEKLRILPCSHAYHSKCIDPWLTRNRRVCPMCKRKVFAQNEQISDNDSMSEEDDHTPLLRSAQRTQGGTFSNANQFFRARNPFDRRESTSTSSTSSVEVSSPSNGGRSLESGGWRSLVSNDCSGGNHGGGGSVSCESQCCCSNHGQCCCNSGIPPPSSTQCPDSAGTTTSAMPDGANEVSDVPTCEVCVHPDSGDQHGDLINFVPSDANPGHSTFYT